MYKSFQSTPHKLKFISEAGLKQEQDIRIEKAKKLAQKELVKQYQSQNTLFNKFENLGDSDWQSLTTVADETGIAYSYKNWVINFPIIDIRTLSYYTSEILLLDAVDGNFFVPSSDYLIKYQGWDIKELVEGEENLVQANFNCSIFITKMGEWTTVPNFQCKLLMYYVNAGLR